MNSKDKIIGKIFENPRKEYYLRELARELKLNPSRLSIILKELKKEGFLELNKKKHILEIKPRFDSDIFRNKKRIFNLNNIYSSNLVEKLKIEYNPKSIVLYGSFSQGTDLEMSDVDIAIFSNINKEKNLDLSTFEKILKRKIHLMIIEKNKITDELYSNIINGIVLYGYLDKKE